MRSHIQPQNARLAAAALDYDIGFAGRPSRSLDVIDITGQVTGWAPDPEDRYPCCDTAEHSSDERDRKRRVHIRTIEHVAARHDVDPFALLRLTRLVETIRHDLHSDLTVRHPQDNVLQALLPLTQDVERLQVYLRSGIDPQDAVRIEQDGDAEGFAAVQALAALRAAPSR